MAVCVEGEVVGALLGLVGDIASVVLGRLVRGEVGREGGSWAVVVEGGGVDIGRWGCEGWVE